MRDPVVSVKMITYNQAPFIGQAIEGVLTQKTNFPFELIIGEDCSTDGTREIVFEYEKKFPNIIRAITSEKNVGAKKNGYRTTKACRGKYIAFCEGDDYWHNINKLQKQVDYLEAHPKCGLVFSDYDVYHVKSQKRVKDLIKFKKWKIPKTPDLEGFVEGNGFYAYGILTCTVMVRKNLYWQIIEADPYLHQSGPFMRGDTQLWAEISTKSDVHYLPESLATYNIREESATNSPDIKKSIRVQIADAELGIYLCNKYHLPSCVKNEQERRLDYNSLRLCFHMQNGKLANEIRNKKRAFSLKEWLLYWGAQNAAVYKVFQLAFLLSKKLNKKHQLFKEYS